MILKRDVPLHLRMRRWRRFAPVDAAYCFFSRVMPALTFDDVMIQPLFSTVESRKDPVLTTLLARGLETAFPFVPANMTDVIGLELAGLIIRSGGVPILHRYPAPECQIPILAELNAIRAGRTIASVGLRNVRASFAAAKQLINAGAAGICVDIAHGDCTRMVELIRELRRWVNAEIQIIAGNVCTRGGYLRLVRAGADAVKIGVGPGSPCTTRITTGCGYVQWQALNDIGSLARREGVPMIADGGIRTSGDIMKCLGAGAHSVMIGSAFAGTIESAAKKEGGRARYRGQASKAARLANGSHEPHAAEEGIERWPKVTGSAVDLINEFIAGIRSGMSYVDALTVEQIFENTLFRHCSYHASAEAHPQPSSPVPIAA